VPEQTGVRHKKTQHSWLAFIGNAGLELFKDTQALIVFIGEIALSLFALIRRKISFRLIDFWLNIQESGPSALPIISLISLLVGLILAFVGEESMRAYQERSSLRGISRTFRSGCRARPWPLG
jgi:phospholipid/cholesterol/gamma-HCH transport system permease protein